MEETREEGGDTVDKVNTTGVEGDEMDQDTSICKVSASGCKVSKGKKRKTVDNELSSFAQTLGDYMKNSNECFSTLVVRMGTKYDSKIARTNLNEITKGIPGLSLQKKLKVSDELVQNNQRLDYFMSLPVDEPTEYRCCDNNSDSSMHNKQHHTWTYRSLPDLKDLRFSSLGFRRVRNFSPPPQYH
ncbi:hypothetical protein ACS0TY_023320 [Phlomoides rotata]